MNTLSIFPNFSFYHSVAENPIFNCFAQLIEAYNNSSDLSTFRSEYLDLYYKLKTNMFKYAFQKKEFNHYARTPWKDFIISSIISEENPLTSLLERSIVTPSHPFYKSISNEINKFFDLYCFDWDSFLEETSLDITNLFSSSVFFPLPPYNTISMAFEQYPDHAFEKINLFIYEYGLHIIDNNFYFVFDGSSQHLRVDNSFKKFHFSNLFISEESQNKIITNTLNFIQDENSANLLLQGITDADAKALIRSLLNEVITANLHIIELPNKNLEYLPRIIDIIKQYPYPFIIFIDNLDFNEYEKQHLCEFWDNCPENTLLYATCKERLLIADEILKYSDSQYAKNLLQERLSFFRHFGSVITFKAPTHAEYLSIVKTLAEKEKITMAETKIENLAIQWELKHLDRSVQSAKHFVIYLKNNLL